MTKTAEKKKDRAEAIEKLREMYPPGSTVSTLLRHVSRSGMQRTVCVIKNEEDVSWLVARALDMRFDRDRGGVKVTGCGMDMGFHVAYSLSRTLYPEGFGCIGKPNDAAHRWSGACPSHDHSNGDRDYAPHCDGNHGPTCVGCGRGHTHWHKDGGYALLHRWI